MATAQPRLWSYQTGSHNPLRRGYPDGEKAGNPQPGCRANLSMRASVRRRAISVQSENEFVALLDRFEQRLKSATHLFVQSENGGRTGVIAAVAAAVELIGAIDRLSHQDLAMPLAMLIGALHDLDDGKQTPLLTPTVFGNRPPDSHAVQAVCAYAAWTMDWLMRLSVKKSDAASKVANTLQAAGFTFGQFRGLPKNTVAAWRDRLKRGNGRAFEASVWQDLQDTDWQIGTVSKSALQRDILQMLEHVTRAARADSSN